MVPHTPCIVATSMVISSMKELSLTTGTATTTTILLLTTMYYYHDPLLLLLLLTVLLLLQWYYRLPGMGARVECVVLSIHRFAKSIINVLRNLPKSMIF